MSADVGAAGPGRRWIYGAALVVVTLAAYLPALRGGFIWDDDQYVTENLAVRAADGLRRIWLDPWSTPQYYPLTLSSFWLEHRLFGLNPAAYHVTNVLLHCASALLLARILRRLQVPGSWWTAALFALHPVHLESVAWITERKNVLSGLFFFLSLLTWIRFAPPDEERRGPSRWWLISFALFVCALLSKTVTSTLPAVALLVVWWKKGRIRVSDVAPLAPFFVLGVAAGAWTGWLERHRVGAWGPDWDLSVVERVLVAGRAIWFYALKLLFPSPLIFEYPRWTVDAGRPFLYLFPLAALAVLALLWRLRGRIGRGPLTAALYFVGMLFPALSFVNVYPMLYSFVADHFQYLASVGPLAMAGAWIDLGASRSRALILGAAILWLLALALLTHQRAAVFADVEALWKDTLSKNSAAWMARSNVATLLHRRAAEPELAEDDRLHLLSEAEHEYRVALDIHPDNLPARVNLARLLDSRGDSEAAEREFRTILDAPNRFPPESRGYLQRGDAWFHYGRFLESKNRIAEAEAAYRKAIEIHPAFDLAWATLGGILGRQERMQEARAAIEESMRLNPNAMAPALTNLGSLEASEGRLDEAIELWRRAIASDPRFAPAHSNLGRALMMNGDLEGAVLSLHRAVELDPSLESARVTLAKCLERLRTHQLSDPRPDAQSP